MPIKPVKAVKVLKHGKVRWRVFKPKSLGGGAKFFRTAKAANDFAAAQEAVRSGKAHRVSALPEAELNAIAHAIDFVGWDRIDELVTAAREYAAHNGCAPATVEDAIAQCIESKRKAGCRERYLGALEASLKRFQNGREKLSFREVTRGDVEDFIGAEHSATGKPVSAWTRRARWIDLRTLFSFAVARGFARENLAEKIDAVRVDKSAPEILTPTQANDFMRAVHANAPKLIPFAALCLFGGLRPNEALQVTWEDVGEGDTINLSAIASKTRQRRLVTKNPTLAAWLKLGGDLPTTGPRSRVIREFLNPWPKNGLRHSFVSYHYALHGASATAREAGHSEAILHAHYRALVTKESANEFWALTPSEVLNR